jgi:hypothetical protein
MRNKITVTLGLLFLFSLPALAQTGNSEVSANFTGNFQAQASGLGTTDSSSNSGGFLVNYRYHFNTWSALEVDYGRTRYTQFYFPTGGSITSQTQANLNQVTFSYVVTFGERNFKGIKPYVDVGTGALIFSPVSAGTTAGSLTQDRATFVAGGGAEWFASKHIGIRAGARVLVYKAPDFTIPAQVTNAVTAQLEPYAGVTFRF